MPPFPKRVKPIIKQLLKLQRLESKSKRKKKVNYFFSVVSMIARYELEGFPVNVHQTSDGSTVDMQDIGLSLIFTKCKEKGKPEFTIVMADYNDRESAKGSAVWVRTLIEKQKKAMII